MSEKITKVVVIGAYGRMGSAIMQLLQRQNNYAAFGVGSKDDLTVLEDADIAVLAIEPGAFNDAQATDKLRKHMGAHTDVVSIVNGGTTEQLRRRLGTDRVVRTMPNRALRHGASMTAVYCESDAVDREAVGTMVASWGEVMELEDESMFAAVTAVSGCTIAFLARKAKAIESAALSYGFSTEQARLIRSQALKGTYLELDSGMTTDETIAGITTPGGSTEQMMFALDASGADLYDLEAIDAARRKSEQLSQQG